MQPALIPQKEVPPMSHREDGQWYVVVKCAHCEKTVYLFRDLTGGTGRLDANYIVTCPQCGYKGAYSARHQHSGASDNTSRQLS